MGIGWRSVSRTIERGIKAAIVVVFVVGVRQRNPGAVTNAVLSFVGTYLPRSIEYGLGVQFRPWQRIYVDAAMITHAVGMLGPYDDIWWWDHLTHVLSSSILGGFAFVRARRRGHNPTRHVITVVLGGGVLWELLEFLIHATANRLGIEPVLVFYSKTDTVLDLVSNLTGALLVIVLGDYFLGNLIPVSVRSRAATRSSGSDIDPSRSR